MAKKNEQSPHIDETWYELEEGTTRKTFSKVFPGVPNTPATIDDYVDSGDFE
jgi:hypothetical protein